MYRVEVVTEETAWYRHWVEVEAETPEQAEVQAVQWVDDVGGSTWPSSWIHSDYGATKAVSVEEINEGGVL